MRFFIEPFAGSVHNTGLINKVVPYQRLLCFDENTPTPPILELKTDWTKHCCCCYHTGSEFTLQLAQV